MWLIFFKWLFKKTDFMRSRVESLILPFDLEWSCGLYWQIVCHIGSTLLLLSMYLEKHWASLVAQTVKHSPDTQETRVQSLGQEDPLKKGRLPTPSFLSEELHGQRSLAGYSPWGHKESDMTEQLTHIQETLPASILTFDVLTLPCK